MSVVLAAIATVALLALLPQAHGRRSAGHPARSATGATRGASRTGPAASPPRWRLVALGDSVPAGTACACPTFVRLYAGRLAARYHAQVSAADLGMPGQTSGGLLRVLDSEPALSRAVAGADIVTLTIGANDFAFADYLSGPCPHLACYAGGLAALGRNMRALLARMRALRAGRATAVLVTGYWEIWEDGAVGRANGRTYMSVGDALTRRVNAVIAAAARAAGTTYVDLYAPFRGTGDRDDTGLLAADGDHPSATGHALIAALLAAAGVAPLRA